MDASAAGEDTCKDVVALADQRCELICSIAVGSGSAECTALKVRPDSVRRPPALIAGRCRPSEFATCGSSDARVRSLRRPWRAGVADHGDGSHPALLAQSARAAYSSCTRVRRLVRPSRSDNPALSGITRHGVAVATEPRVFGFTRASRRHGPQRPNVIRGLGEMALGMPGRAW